MFCYAYARVRLFELPHVLDEINVDSISKGSYGSCIETYIHIDKNNMTGLGVFHHIRLIHMFSVIY